MNFSALRQISAKPSSLSLAISLLALPIASPAQDAGVGAVPAAGVMEEVIVFGRGTQLLGAADASSEGSVAGADLLVRPMLRTAELLEAVPGMVALQHSGSGKATVGNVNVSIKADGTWNVTRNTARSDPAD